MEKHKINIPRTCFGGNARLGLENLLGDVAVAQAEGGTPFVSTNAPQTYCNGFTLNLSSADVSILLVWNGTNTSTVSMSFTTAKTLMKGLTDVIQKLESASGRDIMDIDFVSQIIGTMNKPNDEE